MKFFISWYSDPPDPKYWDWFDIDGIMISIGPLRGSLLTKAINLGVHRFTGYKGPIFLDSGAFQNNLRKTQLEVLELQNWLQPDYVSHLDRPFLSFESTRSEEKWTVLKETLENAKIARKWEKANDHIEVVYVIQGWDRESLEICSEKMSQLKCDYYGIGSLYKKSPRQIYERIKIVRQYIDKEAKLHLFGVSPQKLIQDKEIDFTVCDIHSIDSSSPMRAGVVKELINPLNLNRLHIDESINECNCPICKKYPHHKELIGIKGNLKQHNKIRAIHNAYWLTEVFRNNIV